MIDLYATCLACRETHWVNVAGRLARHKRTWFNPRINNWRSEWCPAENMHHRMHRRTEVDYSPIGGSPLPPAYILPLDLKRWRLS